MPASCTVCRVANTPVITTSIPNAVTYYVSQTVNGCESDRSIVAIVIDEKVDASISLNASTICQYDTITVSSNGINPSSSVCNWNFGNASVLNGSNAGPFYYDIRYQCDNNQTFEKKGEVILIR